LATPAEDGSGEATSFCAGLEGRGGFLADEALVRELLGCFAAGSSSELVLVDLRKEGFAAGFVAGCSLALVLGDLRVGSYRQGNRMSHLGFYGEHWAAVATAAVATMVVATAAVVKVTVHTL